MRYRITKKVKYIVLFIVLFAFATTMVMPFLWTLSSSFKPANRIFTNPVKWIPDKVTMTNYKTVLTEMNFLRYFSNTLYIALVVTIGQIVCCSLAAYAFAKIKFKGRDKLFLAYLSTMMVPFNAILIPQFIIVNKLGLYDKLESLILLHMFAAFGVFMFRQFMISIPDELLEAARIDGCNEFKIYLKIVMPQCIPASATVAIFTFNSMWNNYMGAKIYLISKKNQTIQLALAMFRTDYNIEYGPLTAGIILSLIPTLLIFILGQKYLLAGIKFSGTKG